MLITVISKRGKSRATLIKTRRKREMERNGNGREVRQNKGQIDLLTATKKRTRPRI